MMKAHIINNIPEFHPFVLSLEVETLGEAKLLFHVFNRNGLKEAIFTGYGEDDTDVALSLTDNSVSEVIEKRLLEYGFSV